MRLGDRAFSALLRLPRASHDYTVTRDVRVPMRDGVDLLADHYVPTGAARGTILVRSPYGRRSAFGLLYARPYAERGYHVIIQSCRGSFGSGGVTTPMLGEVEDGADTVAWLRTQPWFKGRFATLGMSYLGYTQWCVLADPPPELVASVIIAGPHDIGDAMYGTGAFSLELALGWSHTLVHQEEHGFVGGLVAGARAKGAVDAALAELPLSTAARGLLREGPWYTDWVTDQDLEGDYWDARQVRRSLDRVGIPVLVVAGWQDIFLEQNLHAYTTLRDRGVDVALTVGPWTHASMVAKGSGVVTREALDWLSAHLAQDGPSTRRAPVHVHVTGADEWRDLPTWPPVSEPTSLFLQPGGRLGPQAPTGAAPVTFTYDPADPTPTIGGHSLVPTAGSRDNATREARADVLTFTGPVLTSPLEVVGTPVVELAHSSDNPHADVFVRLCEVTAKGVSLNLTDAYVRLGSSDDLLSLTLRPITHRFAAGSRLRLQVSGGSFPQYDRNLGTGEDPLIGTEMKASRREIALGASRLRLPIGT